MDIDIQPGRYVVAVSGGVDSMALLHMLTQLSQSEYQFTVAHFDHGIRKDSSKDLALVRSYARTYGLPFVFDEGNLGVGASEATARDARYKFLHTVRKNAGAHAIVTAHHQDDVLETTILNLRRGTGRKGMASLRSTDIIKRPLLHVPKTELYNYAKAHQLTWREDSTNTDMAYARNRVRHSIVPKFTVAQRQAFLKHIEAAQTLNEHIDTLLLQYLQAQPSKTWLDRKHFMLLPHAVGIELFALWLRENGIRGFDKKGLQRMAAQAKTLQHGQRIDVNVDYFIAVEKTKLILTPRATSARP